MVKRKEGEGVGVKGGEGRYEVCVCGVEERVEGFEELGGGDAKMEVGEVKGRNVVRGDEMKGIGGVEIE
ncbi:hypothetical protein, partial [Paenibacillus xylanexedens]|uniref:hypothetical protein n=1 Tax=Paenibacillus xylanexedens TaxID=528191 RepID=UPI0011A13811